ncbi:MAG: Nif3-like dinuclear metal center hexameric protein [Deltaproteobacteria bacterium]|nr:Nif3-like dinuclear metal center hexameric protein [Deltaproteobacteria bacterium]
MKLKEIIHTFERRVPKSLQEKWDYSGLNLGSPDHKVTSVLFSYDICKEVIDAAIKKRCQLIVSHHPYRMNATVNMDLDSYEGQIITRCIKNNIALYSSHTNHDASEDSLNIYYLRKLKLKDIKPLARAETKLFKLAVYVPCTHTNKVMNALFKAGAGHIGNYSECSFRTQGTGSFKGNSFTNPAIGKKMQREEVLEDRLEVILRELDLDTVLAGLKTAHPYEEVAYDIYPLQNKITSLGIGAFGYSQKGFTRTECIKKIKQIFKIKHLRFVPGPNKKYKTIGICTGSGASLINTALMNNLDLFITGDVKYHQAIHAKRHNLSIADVGHFHSEKESALLLKNIFASLFKSQLNYLIYKDLKDAFLTA